MCEEIAKFRVYRGRWTRRFNEPLPSLQVILHDHCEGEKGLDHFGGGFRGDHNATRRQLHVAGQVG